MALHRLESIRQRISDRELANALDNAVQRNNAYYNAAFDALSIIQEKAELDAMAAEVEGRSH